MKCPYCASDLDLLKKCEDDKHTACVCCPDCQMFCVIGPDLGTEKAAVKEAKKIAVIGMVEIEKHRMKCNMTRGELRKAAETTLEHRV